jgi:indolepyruvate ferredoxin oxidoreductase beta subunit
MDQVFKILVVGTGGQGVLTVARIIGEAALSQQMVVRVGQLHGMAQRGGSVESAVFLGPGASAFIEDGEADVVLGLEPLETLRALPRMSSRTAVLISTGRIVPFVLVRLGQQYPDLDQVLEQVRARAGEVTVLDGPALLRQADAPRSLNMLMLGALAAKELLPLSLSTIREAMERRVPARHLPPNQAAFQVGVEAVSSPMKSRASS